MNVTSAVMSWMSACQSILCTVHPTWSLCYPDGLCIWPCCPLVEPQTPSSVWPYWFKCSDLLACAVTLHNIQCVCIVVWGFVYVCNGNAWLIKRQSPIPCPTKFLKKTKEKSWKCFNALLHFSFWSLFSVLLWRNIIKSIHIDIRLKGSGYFYKDIGLCFS